MLLARRSARSARWAGLSEGRAVRDLALVAGQTRQHDAGWWGGAGWTIGDRHPRLWCAWGTSASCTFCPIDCARRMRKKLQPCAWCHVAKVGPTDPASCVRCYISVLRLETDPNPPNFCWVNIGGVIIKLSADPLSEAPIDERDMFDYRRPYVELWTLTATCHQCARVFSCCVSVTVF